MGLCGVVGVYLGLCEFMGFMWSCGVYLGLCGVYVELWGFIWICVSLCGVCVGLFPPEAELHPCSFPAWLSQEKPLPATPGEDALTSLHFHIACVHPHFN